MAVRDGAGRTMREVVPPSDVICVVAYVCSSPLNIDTARQSATAACGGGVENRIRQRMPDIETHDPILEEEPHAEYAAG
ncbi:hypothetical protein [Agrobacterium leguminum]